MLWLSKNTASCSAPSTGLNFRELSASGTAPRSGQIFGKLQALLRAPLGALRSSPEPGATGASQSTASGHLQFKTLQTASEDRFLMWSEADGFPHRVPARNVGGVVVSVSTRTAPHRGAPLLGGVPGAVFSKPQRPVRCSVQNNLKPGFRCGAWCYRSRKSKHW